MSYIKFYGIALPQFRIEDNLLHPRGKKGVMRSVCFPDEDIITLAFKATENIPKDNIDGILFATSTQVFQNRYHASFLAGLLGLPDGILAFDFLNTARSGSDALLFANTLIDSKKYNNILVIAADAKFPEVGKEVNTPFGHAACAILLSNEKSETEICYSKNFSSSFAEEFIYKCKSIMFDPRFSRDAGFKTNQIALLKNLPKNMPDFDAIILNSLYARMAGDIYTKAGFNIKQFARDTLMEKIGNTGSVHALLLLINELESNKKNILLVDYTNGSNVFHINNNAESDIKQLKVQADNFELINSYQDYLLMQKAGNFNTPSYETKEMFSSEMMQEREKDTLTYLKGHKCEKCGTIYYIESAQCKNCKANKFIEVQLSKTGTVYAFTHEHYFPASFPPITMIVIDLDGGGRITVQKTNTMYPIKNKLAIGDKVQLVLRKMIENDLKPNYFWKAI